MDGNDRPMHSDLTPQCCRIMRTNWSRADRLCGLSGNLQNSAERSPSFSPRTARAPARGNDLCALAMVVTFAGIAVSSCHTGNVQGGHHGTTRSKGGARDRLTTVTVWLPAFRTPAPWIVRVGRTVCCQPTPWGTIRRRTRYAAPRCHERPSASPLLCIFTSDPRCLW
jgi:hypothetical protein